jgi:hypothetical protein
VRGHTCGAIYIFSRAKSASTDVPVAVLTSVVCVKLSTMNFPSAARARTSSAPLLCCTTSVSKRVRHYVVLLTLVIVIIHGTGPTGPLVLSSPEPRVRPPSPSEPLPPPSSPSERSSEKSAKSSSRGSLSLRDTDITILRMLV